MEDLFFIEQPECSFIFLSPVIFRGPGDTGLCRTELADNSSSNRIFCDGFGETFFLGRSGDLLLNGEEHLSRSDDLDFELLYGGSVFFFREQRGKTSSSLLLHVQ